jgi:uncharacterized membrane protein
MPSPGHARHLRHTFLTERIQASLNRDSLVQGLYVVVDETVIACALGRWYLSEAGDCRLMKLALEEMLHDF